MKENVGEVWCFVVVCKGYLSCSAAVEDRQLQENPYIRAGSEKKKSRPKMRPFRLDANPRQLNRSPLQIRQQAQVQSA